MLHRLTSDRIICKLSLRALSLLLHIRPGHLQERCSEGWCVFTCAAAITFLLAFAVNHAQTTLALPPPFINLLLSATSPTILTLARRSSAASATVDSHNYLLGLEDWQLQIERRCTQQLDEKYAEKLDRAVTAMYQILESVKADRPSWDQQIITNTIHPSVFVYKARVIERKLSLIRRNMAFLHPTFLDELHHADRHIEKIALERVQASMVSSMKDSYFSGIMHAALLWILANIVALYFEEHAAFVKWALVALGIPLVSQGWAMAEVPSVGTWVRSRRW